MGTTSATFEDVKKRCLAQKILYEDRDFPVTAASLFLDGPVENVEWKRPKEISQHPQFIQKDVTYYDFDQGQLGNCWFVASVACIAASPQKKLMNRILPEDQGFGSDYCGAFRFNFWQYGKWVEVVVDDRLPTVKNKLIYGKNKQQTNEFWCPLMEKAFAKLYGSYHAIDGGFMDQCLVDLTGGIGDAVALGTHTTTDTMRELLSTCFQMNSVIGGVTSTIPNQREVLQDSGLYSGHAYTIINVKQVTTNEKEKVTLLHVRNPWGTGDWKGAWSDGSKEWKTLNKEDRDATIKYWSDGEFWISVDDFRKHFSFVVMAHLTPDAHSEEIADNLQRTQWKQSEHHGSWIRGVSAGGPLKSFTSKTFWSNPQFKIKLSQATKPTTVIIQLLEINTPPIRTMGDVSIGFIVFKLKQGKQPRRITGDNYFEFSPRLVSTSGLFTPHREVTGRFVMDPADHVIVPCTHRAGQQAEFYMRIFSEKPVTTGEFDGPDTNVDTSEKEEAKPDGILDKEFDKLSDASGGIDAEDLQNLLGVVISPGDRMQKTYGIETSRCLLSAANAYAESKLAKKEQVMKAVSNLRNLTRVFKLIDTDNTGFVEKPELRLLFKILEYGVSDDLVDSIMTRYGGRNQRLGLEDFVQICSKLVSFETKAKKKSCEGAYHSGTRQNAREFSQEEMFIFSFL